MGNNQSFLLEFWKHFWRRFSSKANKRFHSLADSEDEMKNQAFFHAFFKNETLRSSQQSLDFHSLFAESVPILEFKKEVVEEAGSTTNSALIDDLSSALIGRKKKRAAAVEDAGSSRASRFRGVSRNGNQWQVLIMINKKKRYVGSFMTEEEAAREYDKVAIKYNMGKSRPNFFYSQEEIEKIKKDDKIIKFD